MFDGVLFIDAVELKNKRVLLRADFDVSLNPDFSIADDARIRQNLPTIKFLTDKKNKLICVAKLDRPQKKDPRYSLKIVVNRLKKYLPLFEIKLIDNFLAEDRSTFENQKENEVLVLENIRFFEEEKFNDSYFAKKLADLAEAYVNDAFAMCHRIEASVVGVPKFLPSYGGLLLKKEKEKISKIFNNPEKPFVAIIGGAKISTKIHVIDKLLELADYLLVGGGMANVILDAKGVNIGKIFFSEEDRALARHLIQTTSEKNTKLVLPTDAIVGVPHDRNYLDVVKKINQIPANVYILDIGPQTQARYGAIIAKAKTIIWNGPMGFIEDSQYRRGTDFIYYAITQNSGAYSVVGGGDTLATISKEEYLEKITHLSTGGGAMLEFIEKGTLPGIEALKASAMSFST